MTMSKPSATGKYRANWSYADFLSSKMENCSASVGKATVSKNAMEDGYPEPLRFHG